MFNFVKGDLYKNRSTKSIYIVFVVSALISLVIMFVMKQIAGGEMGAEMGINISLMSDTMLAAIFGGIIAGGLIVDDFESKTVHNEIISGQGRLSIILGKLISFSLIFTFVLLPYALVTIISAAAGGDFAPLRGIPSAFFDLLAGASAEGSSAIPKCILLCVVIVFMYIARLSICIPIAFKVRKKIPVLVTGFVTAFIFDILSSLVKDVKGVSDVVKALPYYQTTQLSIDASSGDIIRAFLSAAVFLAAMAGITYLLFKKDEIK